MNSLLIFFAIPLATIILSIILETLIRCPFKVAGIAFSIFIVLAFALGGSAVLIVAAIIYTIISFISAFITMIVQNRIEDYDCDNDWNNIYSNSWNNSYTNNLNNAYSNNLNNSYTNNLNNRNSGCNSNNWTNNNNNSRSVSCRRCN